MNSPKKRVGMLAGLGVILVGCGPCIRSNYLCFCHPRAPIRVGSMMTLPESKPLIDAIEKEDVGEVRRLLDSGISPNSIAPWPPDSSEGPFTALMCAAGEGNLAISRLLLDRGADINVPNMWGQTALISASWGNPAVVKLLIERGADVNADDDGATALGYVTHHLDYDCKTNEERHRYEEVAELLKGAGAHQWPFPFWW